MSEWWTYTLSDFLLFSPRTYYRLFELYNADIWPAQIVALALGAAILVLSHRADAWGGRVIAAILGVCWLWIAWAFHGERYATINWAATYVAVGFAVEGLLLLWVGSIRNRLLFQGNGKHTTWAGLIVFLFALVVQPLIGPVVGREWVQVEVFGVAPDPTAVATLGVLLGVTGRVFWLLAALPIAWCMITGATLWTMGSVDALVTPLAAIICVVWRLRRRR
ncbi:MAG TPA: DUF6064 family protein [Vineibacter sp.]|nr:DUF6064 family protein [Vineibacter sp.]